MEICAENYHIFAKRHCCDVRKFLLWYDANMNWFFSSLVAAVLLAAHMLILKKLSLGGMSVTAFTFLTWLVSVGIFIGYFILTRQSPFVGLGKATTVVWLVIAAAVLWGGALALNRGIVAAPNPGYATAVASAQVALVVLFSVLFFGSSFSIFKAAGAALVISGVVLLGL